MNKYAIRIDTFWVHGWKIALYYVKIMSIMSLGNLEHKFRTCRSFEVEGSSCLPINSINPLSANPTKWSNTLKQFVDNLPTNCLSWLDHFVGLALKGLRSDNNFCLSLAYIIARLYIRSQIKTGFINKWNE